ncbi:MAG: TetR/AcrR family transcriptional regulator [Eubacterium sp.]|nr:TetR/AcrR family transcriptional regulator [Eubacterium sp.]
MPRDKTRTHIRVLEAARKEFLEKGYEKASIRAIGESAGITSAGLYRHCKDKEDLFCQVVQPALDALHEWIANHIKNSYESIEKHEYMGLEHQTEIDLVREAVIPYCVEYKLLLTKSGGTRYENFFHDMITEHEKKMQIGLEVMRQYGFDVKELSHEELHIIISAYMTALFEPIVRDYEPDKIEHYLDTVEKFFMPGWHELWGI